MKTILAAALLALSVIAAHAQAAGPTLSANAYTGVIPDTCAVQVTPAPPTALVCSIVSAAPNVPLGALPSNGTVYTMTLTATVATQKCTTDSSQTPPLTTCIVGTSGVSPPLAYKATTAGAPSGLKVGP